MMTGFRRMLMKTVNVLVMAAMLLAAVPGLLAAGSELGVTDREIVIGMCNALTGPASALGTGVKKGASVYFDRINKEGGVHGRKVRIISVDDGYEPKNTIAQTKKLIAEDKVFALFGYVGTPTSAAIVPFINLAKIPFWGPFTGAELLRSPVNRYIFNIRGSYFDEAETQVRHLVDEKGIKRIGIFYQDDAYGLAVKGGVLKALRKRNLELAGYGTYERNTEDVASGLARLRKADPEAVILVGTYKAMAVFIKQAKAGGFNPVFLNVSFVGTSALVKELAGTGNGTLVTQVMPSPQDATVPLIAQYQRDMKAAGHRELDYTDLEGYVNAAVFAEVLKRVGPDLARESFIQTAENLNARIGGLEVRFAPADHQALRAIYLTRVSGNYVIPVP
jgi:branched-chain amino acid transport system substrate-binding protein